jgi:IclR family transcriptional regulator, acetate operon repressor
MAGNSSEPGRTVVSKTATILLALTMGGGHTLSSLSCQTRLPISTVHRHIRDLARTPLVERNADGEYRPGPALHNLAHCATSPTLHSHGPLAVDDLAAALNRTVRLGVLHRLQLSYVEKKPGLQAGTSFPNSARLPLHATASGKALLAFMPTTFLRVVAAAGFPRYTPHTVTSIDELRHLLVQVRRHGFATSHLELHPSACAVAVPLFNHNGYPVCAMEVQVPDLTESTLAQVTPALVITARRLSRELSPPQEPGTPAAAGGP